MVEVACLISLVVSWGLLPITFSNNLTLSFYKLGQINDDDDDDVSIAYSVAAE